MTAITGRLGHIDWRGPTTIGVLGIGARPARVLARAAAARGALAPLLPIVVGMLAIAAGIWAWSRDERRVGGGAVAAGLARDRPRRCSRPIRRRRTSTQSSSGARCSRRPSATRRR